MINEDITLKKIEKDKLIIMAVGIENLGEEEITMKEEEEITEVEMKANGEDEIIMMIVHKAKIITGTINKGIAGIIITERP
jgi:hypothetical protein